MYVLILNPTSGSGRSERILPRLIEICRERGLSWRVQETHRPGEARTLAAAAVRDGAEAVIAVGGDGTLSEAAAGLQGSGVPLLFASCGTGNDFIKAAHLPKDPAAALALQLDAPRSRIDVGRVNEHCFINVSGTGLDVDVLVEAQKHKKNASGLRPYLQGVADAIKKYRPVEAQLGYDDEPLHEARFTILSIGNGQYIGGGMRAVPGATLNDGFFDTVEVRPVRRWQIAVLLVLFITGLHARTGLATCRRVKKLHLRRPGMVLNLDGELIPCDDAEFEVLPGALTVQLPAAAK